MAGCKRRKQFTERGEEGRVPPPQFERVTVTLKGRSGEK